MFDNIVSEYAQYLDTTKIGVVGHSSGGGFAFKILEHFIEKGYGRNGRFLCVLDTYFAQYMNKANIENLSHTNVLFVQFGPSGNSTDPRIPLVLYSLLNGEGIDKNYIVLHYDNDHGYPARQNISRMQGLLRPLDALMHYTFHGYNSSDYIVALTGPGKIDPYANGYQKVLEIDAYPYSCEYVHSHGYHKGPDGVSLTDINNCGEPTIAPN